MDGTRAFVERTGVLRPELAAQIRAKALAAGLVAANMPEEVGGAGLDTVTWVLYEKELGRTGYVLQYTGVPRPSNVLLAGAEEQRRRYLYPCVRGEEVDCLAMTEPGAGSDMRAGPDRALDRPRTGGIAPLVARQEPPVTELDRVGEEGRHLLGIGIGVRLMSDFSGSSSH